MPPKPHIGMYFKCCSVYARIYLNHDKTAFAGNCPKCGARIRLEVKPGGSDAKFWAAE